VRKTTVLSPIKSTKTILEKNHKKTILRNTSVLTEKILEKKNIKKQGKKTMLETL
jgi:hypothetical protein